MNNPNIGDVDQKEDNNLIMTHKSHHFESGSPSLYMTLIDKNSFLRHPVGLVGLEHWPCSHKKPNSDLDIYFTSSPICLSSFPDNF